MKNHTIKTPTAELLIVEIPELGGYNLNKNRIAFYDNSKKERLHIKGNYTLLGKPDEISEEDARELVERIGEGDPCYQGDWFVNYQDDEYMFETAKESLLSLLESEIFWENPEPQLSDFEYFLPSLNEKLKLEKKFNEAEKKTFDRNRSLIFIKNK